MEFCERGSLYSLVHSKYGKKSLALELRYKMALDITQGMLYLHTRDPPILHRGMSRGKENGLFFSFFFVCVLTNRSLNLFLNAMAQRSQDAQPLGGQELSG
jgi:hypothetical protein